MRRSTAGEIASSDAEKAVPPALQAAAARGGNTPTMVPFSEVINALTSRATLGSTTSVPLPVDPEQRDPFGPGNPLPIAPIDRPRPDTGRPTPRVTEYPIQSNVQLAADRPLDWKLLRRAAKDVNLIRRCIKIRKGHLKPLRWGWVVSDDTIEDQLQAVPKKQRASARDDIEADLRQKLQPEISRLTEFWRTPWSGNQIDLKQWMGMLVEEWLVLDAIAIYPEMTYGGEVLNFKIIDGSTIKPLRDIKGEIPKAPYPAFQQILYGFPRGEFTASLAVDDQGNTVIPGAYLPDQLYYYRDDARTDSPYGISAVEEALVASRMWLNRQGWIISEYDSGTSPMAWITPPFDAAVALGEPFNVQKRREWQRAYNDEMSGNTDKRHETQITPPGWEPHFVPQVDQMYKPDYDMFLIRILAAPLGVTMPELNFTEPGGLGSTGYHEGQEDVQERVGTKPTIDIIQTIVTNLARKYQHCPPELEFRVFGLDSDDEAAQDEVIQAKVASGRMTLNESRDEEGRPRYGFAEADMPMLQTARGVVYLEGSSEQAPPGELVMPAQAPPNSDQPAPADFEPDDDPDADVADDAKQPGKPAAKPAAGAPVDRAAKSAELEAYRNWLRHRPRAGKTFELRALSAGEAHANGIDPGRVTFKAAGDDGPKGQAPDGAEQWPGWSLDLAAAAYWAPLIAAALSGAVDAQQLAEAWIAHAPTVGVAGGDEAEQLARWTTAAATWIERERDAATAALTTVLQGVYADGYVIGSAAATAVVDGTAIDVGAWTVGDTEAARLLLSDLGDGSGLRTLLTQAGITIKSVVDTKLEELGQLLAQGIARGDSADTLAASIRGVLANKSRALMIATTEMNRAVSAATVNNYGRRGITDASWATADDDRVCPVCGGNEAEGPIPLGEPFASGDPHPPAHPWCRCALIAHIVREESR